MKSTEPDDGAHCSVADLYGSSGAPPGWQVTTDDASAGEKYPHILAYSGTLVCYRIVADYRFAVDAEYD